MNIAARSRSLASPPRRWSLGRRPAHGAGARSTSACPSPRPRTASRPASSTGPTRPRRTWRRQHQDLKITIKTAANAPEQANQLQDLLTVDQDQRAGDLPVRVGGADQAGGAGQGQGRLRDGGRPRPHRHQRAGRLRLRRQHRLRQDPGRVPGQGAERQGQHRGAARHPDHDRQRAHGRLQRGDEEPSRTSSCWTPSTATGTATTPSR